MIFIVKILGAKLVGEALRKLYRIALGAISYNFLKSEGKNPVCFLKLRMKWL